MAQYLMTTLFHLLICVGAVFSSPIKPLIVEQKTVVFGLISCIGVFSLVGACLFCKRRKRKFEKLENEAFQSAPICSGNANEYPIFHALTTSPPISAIIPQSATTRSSDNLLENASQNGITIEENARNDEDLENIPALHISQVHMEDELKYVSDIHDIHCIIKSEEANCKSNAIRETTCLDVFGDTNFSSIMQNFQNDSNAVNDNEQKFTRNSLRGSMESLSSVEEALRALDFVIDGADLSPDIISHKEPLSLTEVNNVAVMPISNDHSEKAEINYLAKTLIDDIMRNAISCIEAQRHIHNIQEQATDICTMEHDLFENFTKQVDLTSTPAIQKKYIGASELRSIEKKSLDFAEDTQLNHSSCPSINIETEKGKSDVEEQPINTITPMNTPNEMLYQSNENWHKLIVVNLMQNQPADTGCCIESDPSNITFPNVKTVNNETFEKINDEEWFLHSDRDLEIDLNNTTTYGFPDEGEETHRISREKSIAQLRELLGSTLTFSNHCTAGTVEYSDENDLPRPKEDNDVLDINRGLPYATNTNAEIYVNYNKRCLSPIIEESEDETCKTFVMNADIRCLDSTSTGCIELEAIMGVTKTLMASNDTLFNFEDTLCDENIFSPKNLMQQDHITQSKQSLDLPIADMEYINFKFSSNDILSPDQEADLTFTVEEKTCATVRYVGNNEEERISEISEPDLVSSSLGRNDKTDYDEDLTDQEEELPHESNLFNDEAEQEFLKYQPQQYDSDTDSTPKVTNIGEADTLGNTEATSNHRPHNETLTHYAYAYPDVLKNHSDNLNKHGSSNRPSHNADVMNENNDNVENTDLWNTSDCVIEEALTENVRT